MARSVVFSALALAIQLSANAIHGLSYQPQSAAPSASSAPPPKTVIAPNRPFRDTEPGEVSIVSFNALAPSLHALNQPFATREEYEKLDREGRVPVAVAAAKRLNGDVLCLQEVEGGPEHEASLEMMLSSTEAINDDDMQSNGYDSYIWSPLHPHRHGEVVGLCVAWRSDRHSLVSSSRFRRGLVVQLQENNGGATFSVGNVHLPARPADIYGRLNAVSTACRRIEDHRVSSSVKPLDGAAIMVGDFNCDTDSSPVSLLKTGLVSPGTLFERNYRHKLTKLNAYKLRHGLRFLDAYGDNLRKSVASITVSLKSRGPGSMDHVLFTPGRWGKTRARPTTGPLLETFGGRRSRRRHRAQERKTVRQRTQPPALLRAEAVLATIDPNDTKRTTTIASGLPLLEEGFPSDHLPVGVLLSPLKIPINGDKESLNRSDIVGRETRSVPNRGDAHITRKRHNAIVRAVSAWLTQRGATDFISDEPLYKWKWLADVPHVRKKMRAPDICCVAPIQDTHQNDSENVKELLSTKNDGTLLMIEVTVANKPGLAQKQKEKKYEDLSHILSSAAKVQEAGLAVPAPHVIVVTDMGELPQETIETLESLALLTHVSGVSQEMNSEFIASEILRIRNHWTPTEVAWLS